MLNFDDLLGMNPESVDNFIRTNHNVNHSDIKSAIQKIEKDKRIQSDFTDPIHLNGFDNLYCYEITKEEETLNLEFYFTVKFKGRRKNNWELLHAKMDPRGFTWAKTLSIPYILTLDRYKIRKVS